MEELGLEVFLAHEDLTPSRNWQKEIKKNLKRCDIFIPLLTKKFKESDFASQEIGIAVSEDKFIIPLEIDINPFGFIANIQSLKIDKKNLSNVAKKIINLIKNESNFGKNMKSFVLNQLEKSGSFEEATARVKLLKEFNSFSAEEVNRILDMIINSHNIRNCFYVQRQLKLFFKKYKNKINKDKCDKLDNETKKNFGIS